MFLCIYSGLQLDEIKAAIFDLNAVGDIDLRVWYQIKPVLLTIAILTAVFAVANSFISWKLYYEFAWALFKFVQADIVLRRRYLIFQASLPITISQVPFSLVLMEAQCYVALLKFDLFFFAGFLVQLVIIVYKTNIEWTITLCVIPVSIFSLVAGSFVTRRESYYGSFTVMVGSYRYPSRTLLMPPDNTLRLARVLCLQDVSDVQQELRLPVPSGQEHSYLFRRDNNSSCCRDHCGTHHVHCEFWERPEALRRGRQVGTRTYGPI